MPFEWHCTLKTTLLKNKHKKEKDFKLDIVIQFLTRNNTNVFEKYKSASYRSLQNKTKTYNKYKLKERFVFLRKIIVSGF